MSEAKLSPAKGSAESPWATWSKVDVADELRLDGPFLCRRTGR